MVEWRTDQLMDNYRFIDIFREPAIFDTVAITAMSIRFERHMRHERHETGSQVSMRAIVSSSMEATGSRTPRISRRLRQTCCVVMLTATTLVLSGCAGSMVRNGFTIYGDSQVSHGELAERFHRACRRVSTPVFARPTNDMVGRCECASTALVNYGEQEQWEELRTVWKRGGTSAEFKNLVVSMGQDLYQQHCGSEGNNKSKLNVVMLRGQEQAGKHEDEKMIIETEVSAQDEPQMPTGTFSATTEVANSSLQLDPLALKDPDLVKFIQRKLESLGHFPGPIDGVIGPQTMSALQQYRAQQGISETVSDEEVMSTLIY